MSDASLVKPVASLASAARLVAALGCCVLAGRFAYVAVDAAFAGDKPAPIRAATASTPPSTGPVRASASAPVPPGELLRVTLMVNVGPDRSEVWIGDNTKLGSTPYIGDIECRAREELDVRVIPPKGDPIRVHPTCAPGIMRVTGR